MAIKAGKFILLSGAAYTAPLVNVTGGASVVGELVSAGVGGDDDAVVQCPAGSFDCVGVVENSVASGFLVDVAIAGVADVLLKDSTGANKGYLVQVSDTAGRAISTLSGVPNANEVLGRVGYALEDVVCGADQTVRTILKL